MVFLRLKKKNVFAPRCFFKSDFIHVYKRSYQTFYKYWERLRVVKRLSALQPFLIIIINTKRGRISFLGRSSHLFIYLFYNFFFHYFFLSYFREIRGMKSINHVGKGERNAIKNVLLSMQNNNITKYSASEKEKESRLHDFFVVRY